MKEVKIIGEYIKLGQVLKLCGVTSSGVEAKYMILEKNVKLNDVIVTERGKKIRNGDIVEVKGEKFIIVQE